MAMPFSSSERCTISGFEKTDYPNDFFDVAVGNVPFGQYKVADRQYDQNNFLIHDYFFAKAFKNKISEVTSVPAFSLKAVFGSLTSVSIRWQTGSMTRTTS